MPVYDYMCKSCECLWEEVHSMADSDVPLKKKCPNCGKKKVEKAIVGFPGLASDSNMTPDKKTNGNWSSLIDMMKRGKPKSVQNKLESSKHMTGRRWMG